LCCLNRGIEPLIAIFNLTSNESIRKTRDQFTKNLEKQSVLM